MELMGIASSVSRLLPPASSLSYIVRSQFNHISVGIPHIQRMGYIVVVLEIKINSPFPQNLPCMSKHVPVNAESKMPKSACIAHGNMHTGGLAGNRKECQTCISRAQHNRWIPLLKTALQSQHRLIPFNRTFDIGNSKCDVIQVVNAYHVYFKICE